MERTIEDVKREYEQMNEMTQADFKSTWGELAGKIVIGINNNSDVKSQRAIWELVQNARDESNGRSNIVFEIKDDEFVFQHDGKPFTPFTILALNKQTSGKSKEDKVRVGQYGTGFLTTYKFGLKFILNAPMVFEKNPGEYYLIDDLVIDREPVDKDELMWRLYLTTENLKQNDADNMNKTDAKHLTSFRYQFQGNDTPKNNARDAFNEAKDLTPYVIMLNKTVDTIKYADGENFVQFNSSSNESYANGIYDCELYEIMVEKVNVKEAGSEQDNTIKCLRLDSKEKVEDSDEPKITILIPISDDNGQIVVNSAGKLPRLFLYLPLLGSVKWGVNAFIHSPIFCCDKDSRDYLRLIGDGQNNDAQADSNRKLIDLATEILKRFISNKCHNLYDYKQLCKVNFPVKDDNPKLQAYYEDQQKSWRNFIEKNVTVKTLGGNVELGLVKILSGEQVCAIVKDKELFDSLYDIMAYGYENSIPEKKDFIYWCSTILEWYLDSEDNPHCVSLDDLASEASSKSLDIDDTKWLLVFDKYLVDINNSTIFDNNALIPNRNGDRMLKSDLVKPSKSYGTKAMFVLEHLAENDLKKFVLSDFENILPYSSYEDKDMWKTVKEAIDKLEKSQKEYRLLYEKQKVGNETTINEDEDVLAEAVLADDIRKALFYCLRMILDQSSSSMENRLYPLMMEYYGMENFDCDETLDANEFDKGVVCKMLLRDVLYSYSILGDDGKMAKKSVLMPILKEVVALESWKEILSKYEIYPNQKGEFKFASQVYKEVNIPDGLISFFDKIEMGCTEEDNSKSIRYDLLDKDWDSVFVGTNKKTGADLASPITKRVKDNNFSLEGLDKDSYLEIIRKLSDNQTCDVWKDLFTDIDSRKADLLLSVVEDQDNRNYLFDVISVEDTSKLKTLSELSKMDEIDKIVMLGEQEIEARRRREEEDEFREMLGDYVEEFVQKFLEERIGMSDVQIKNEQGGQDLVIYHSDKRVCLLEIKSRWSANNYSVSLTPTEFRTAVHEADNYCLLYVDMSGYDKDKVVEGVPPTIDEVEHRLYFLTNIGELASELFKEVVDVFDQSKNIFVSTGYKVDVKTCLFENGEDHSLDGYVKWVKEKLNKIV